HLVQMPAIARHRATLAQPSRDRRTELQHPAPDRFVGDVEPSFGQQFLDIAVAQGEAEVEPDRVLDDLRRETMAAVAERGHADILCHTPPTPDPVSVTMPAERLLPRACRSFCADPDRQRPRPTRLERHSARPTGSSFRQAGPWGCRTAPV